ncbi:MAG: endonuclease/exonuclease/phosphatase family protein [Acidobacteria bacterium]|nr:endonuclease/exonuclease/phosphatase family protein [Acidobacteriota bacterium]
MTVQTDWIEGLSKFETLDDLRRSDFYLSDHGRILSFLQTPQLFVNEGASPRLNSFLRVVQWNIEKGKRFDSILDIFRNNEILRYADVVILNEADYGMNRSQNRHVARELAERLGLHMVFGPAHFELTRGTDDDLAVEGENRESLQGNAVLSRYPVLDAVIIPLPVTFEPYEFEEKRFGRRCCLWVKLQLRQSCLWVGSVHLELRNTPRCRAVQVRHIMENLPGEDREAFLLGGDLNTNSFRRGTAWRTILSIFRILFRPAAKVQKQLLHPEKGLEPLFHVLKQKGFFWDGLNANEETARTVISTLEESSMLPDFLMRAVKKRLTPYNGYMCFKLDWFLAKHLRVLNGGRKRDALTGIASVEAGRMNWKNYGPDRTSDHVPIYVDLDLH